MLDDSFDKDSDLGDGEDSENSNEEQGEKKYEVVPERQQTAQ